MGEWTTSASGDAAPAMGELTSASGDAATASSDLRRPRARVLERPPAVLLEPEGVVRRGSVHL